MEVSKLKIEEVVLITPRRFGDDRGYFSETFKDEWFRNTIEDVAFVQDNQSLSVTPGTLRGLHYQLDPFAQGKLVRCIAGSIFDVAVDIREGSATFGQWVGAVLTAEVGEQLWIPTGFAHGFCTLQPDTAVVYKVTAPYSKDHDRGIRFDDPAIGIEWPVSADSAMLSEKDKVQPLLKDAGPGFTYKKRN